MRSKTNNKLSNRQEAAEVEVRRVEEITLVAVETEVEVVEGEDVEEAGEEVVEDITSLVYASDT